MKRQTNLEDHRTVLPYASELFGVYQPLLGWKARRHLRRFSAGFRADRRDIIDRVDGRFVGRARLEVNADGIVTGVAEVAAGEPSGAVHQFDSALMRAIARKLPPVESYDDAVWSQLLRPEAVAEILKRDVPRDSMAWYQRAMQGRGMSRPQAKAALQRRVDRESALAGMLTTLATNGLHADLKDMFYAKRTALPAMLDLLRRADPFEMFDPKKDLHRVALSPIGIVHLFRQYFFEFDTFLGPPVGHVWLSPGATVELFEISTRRTLTEKTLEISSESTIRAEQETTSQDELSDAVKESNRDEVKFGANVNAEQNWVWGSAGQSASFDMTTTQEAAREQSHKQMRQQSTKLSTEIRNNRKSTFKTVTETTDTSSKRYVLENTTDKLINYELRRKMRQVGVQVQDVGTYLCWQSYVDEPGTQLGVAKLMHIAKSPDLDAIPHPDLIEPPKAYVQDYAFEIPFVQTSGDMGDLDESYTMGTETDDDFNDDSPETIQYRFKQTVTCEQVGFVLDDVRFDVSGADVRLSVQDMNQAAGSTKATFIVQANHINFHGRSPIRLVAKLHWQPTDGLTAEIEAKNKQKLATFSARLMREYKAEFANAAKERIKLASKIAPRRYEDLREEERIVVYRRLVNDLLTEGIDQPDDRTRHVVAELINSIFDVDKMLYFVAPEWWKPRERAQQTFGTLVPTGEVLPDGTQEMVPSTSTSVSEENTVGWGGVNESGRDNYHITEDSDPAKLGASLGWLLQLDGDNLRNAFLNAPWVKAVMPIRPGKERAAINWLKQVEGMNGIGPSDLYAGTEPGLVGKTMLQVMETLADQVRDKHEREVKSSSFPDPGDPDKTVTAVPVDRVYEHGFDPLKDGFRADVGAEFEVFDQWVEVLPTDQVVAVEVKYDPKTGRQI